MCTVKLGFSLRSITVYFVLCLLLTGCKVDLYSNLDEREANEMLAVLLKNDIAVSKKPGKKGKVHLSVKESQMADAINILKSHGYPREQFLDVCDIFEKKGLISSPMEERVRFICAVQQGLSETLSQLDGVITARVHVVLPEVDGAGEELVPSSASVFIKYSSDVNLQAFIPQIKLLVNNSIEGLNYGKISVALFPAETLSKDTRPKTPGRAVVKNSDESSNRLYVALAVLAVIVLGSVAFSGFLLFKARRKK